MGKIILRKTFYFTDKCDQRYRCTDNSDELNCPCNESQFQCQCYKNNPVDCNVENYHPVFGPIFNGVFQSSNKMMESEIAQMEAMKIIKLKKL